MTPKDVRTTIEKWTCEHAGMEARGYLGMSQVGGCAIQMYRNALDGPDTAKGSLIRSYEGEMQVAEMLVRMELMGLAQRVTEELSALDGRLRGHPRAELVNSGTPTLVMVKSVNRSNFEDVLDSNRALQKHYEAAQCYLLHGGWSKAVVIYKCRDDGDVWVVEVLPHERAQRRVMDKVLTVLEAIDAGEEPACTCGRH
jgi:hypothetical protein